MTERAPITKLQELSTALAGLVASTAPSVAAVQSHHSRKSGFVWRRALIVTADEALSEDGEVAVTLPGGDKVPAQVVGRDPTTDVAFPTREAPARIGNSIGLSLCVARQGHCRAYRKVRSLKDLRERPERVVGCLASEHPTKPPRRGPAETPGFSARQPWARHVSSALFALPF